MDDTTSSRSSYIAQLHALLKAAAVATDEERWGICAFLHDEVLQSLNVANLQAEKLLLLPTKDGKASIDIAAIREIRDNIYRGIEQTQQLMHEVASPVLKYLGVSAAVHWLVERMNSVNGTEISVEESGSCDLPEEGLKNAFFGAFRDIIEQVQSLGKSAMKVRLRGNEKELEATLLTTLPDQHSAQLRAAREYLNEECNHYEAVTLPLPRLLLAIERCKGAGVLVSINETERGLSIALNAPKSAHFLP